MCCEQQAALAAQQRFVRLGRASEHGLKLIIARAAAGDAIWFKATIDRIADILARQGDMDAVEIRRSKALGILAQPAEALQLLYEHQNDPWNGPVEPADSEQAPTQDKHKTGFEQAEHNAEQDAEPGDATTSDPTLGTETTHRSLQISAPPLDPERARPRAVVYVHVSEEALTAGTGVARVEDVGPVLLGWLRTVLGNQCHITVKSVIDLPAGHIPVDCYEIPARLREQLQLRYPADVFPYAAGVSRRMDIDHTIPYLSLHEGGPPGQTRIGNLGPHVRRNHRVKTHGGWQVRQPEPGRWLWRSPHRRIYMVNATGTHPLGDTEFAQAIWQAAASPPQRSATKPTLTLLRWSRGWSSWWSSDAGTGAPSNDDRLGISVCHPARRTRRG